MTTTNCLSCGTIITVTTRNPNRRFCSPRCRKTAWQARHRRARKSVADVVHNVTDAVPAANGVTRCPHCRQELAVVAVVIPADAAHIQTPGGDHIALT
jgi:endogenous inhibitor of DNA gyrase (YacG/DUF329 family)